MLTPKQIEIITKGYSNHRRIQIMILLDKEPELSHSEISAKVKSDIKNVSEHVRKLKLAGLIIKRHQAKNVRHKLTQRGINVLTFLRTLDK